MLIIRQIADMVRYDEFDRRLKLGHSFGQAIDYSWQCYWEVVELGRAGILEKKNVNVANTSCYLAVK